MHINTLNTDNIHVIPNIPNNLDQKKSSPRVDFDLVVQHFESIGQETRLELEAQNIKLETRKGCHRASGHETDD